MAQALDTHTHANPALRPMAFEREGKATPAALQTASENEACRDTWLITYDYI